MQTRNPLQSTIPTIVGILFMIIGIVAGVLLITERSLMRSRATPSFDAGNIKVSNITHDSFTVSFYSQSEIDVTLWWGNNPKKLDGKINVDKIDRVQHLTITNLSPRSLYFFRLDIGGQFFPDGGDPFSVLTLDKLPQPRKLIFLSGSVTDLNNSPVENALVYLEKEKGHPKSTTTSKNGKWIIPISDIRSVDNSSYIDFTETGKVNILITDGIRNSTIVVTSNKTIDLPQIILGNNYIFSPPEEYLDKFINPKAIIENSVRGVSAAKRITTTDDVDKKSQVFLEVLNIIEGDVLDNNFPEVRGRGTPGLVFKITIDPYPIEEILLINSDGLWSWLPPIKIEGGEHTLVVDYKDSNGDSHIISKNFEVQVLEE